MSQSPQTVIYGHFIQGIQSGQFAIGDRLPTEAQIAEEFGVSRPTVQKVMSRLAHEGLIERFAGRGSFVRDSGAGLRDVKLNIDIHNIRSFESEVALVGGEVTYRLIRFEERALSERAAAVFGVSVDTQTFFLERLRFYGGKAIGIERRYFAPDLEVDMPLSALREAPTHELVEQHLNQKILKIAASLRAVSAVAEEAELLGVAEGTPLLCRTHTLIGEDNRLILHGDSLYLDSFSFDYVASFGA